MLERLVVVVRTRRARVSFVKLPKLPTYPISETQVDIGEHDGRLEGDLERAFDVAHERLPDRLALLEIGRAHV